MGKGCNLLYFFFVLALNGFAQGPVNGFMPQDGQVDLALTYSTEQYDNFWAGDGSNEERSLEGFSYSAFLEYGLDAKTSLVFTVPYIEHNSLNKGWQDASIWFKYRNERTEKQQGISQFITAIGLSVPVSQYPNDNPLAIGRRSTTFQGRLIWQYNANYGWFINIQSGIDFQFAPIAQGAAPFLIRGGLGTSRFYTDIWLERYQSLNATADINNLAAGTGSSWTKSGFTFYVPIQNWVGIFTSGAIILGGRNIGQSRRINLGAVFRLNTN
ncbi:MAG: transporter [Bacteroidota bacterium]